MNYRQILLSISIFLAATVVAIGQPGDFDTTIVMLMEKAHIPGMSIALIDQDEITTKVLGVKDVDSREPVSEHTVFEAASLTKPVFTYAVLRLVDAGNIDLDIPLDHYWKSPEIDASEWPGVITARMVLTHSTGLPNWRNPRDAKQVKVQFEPGNRFSYSGEGFVYLSKVVEQITGVQTRTWLDESVFKPLGMIHSSMIWQDNFDEDCATPHDNNGKSTKKYRPESANVAASLHTTARDYALFMIALEKGTGLSKDSHHLMTHSQRRVDPSCSQCKQPNKHPEFKDVTWALGIGLEHGEQDYLWHWGDNGPFKAYVCVSLATGKGIVFFANSQNGLAVRNALIGAILPGAHPAHKWVGYKQVEE